ncbi:hypothetical protein GCM10022223_11930 [Kineosporia mesophila]|uniref:DUF4288 domain-containing protein n=1 Tax=Kineosporia mesophila TaxID=566012 RepID=A0ABP6Z6J6_9ACTN|nr:DUF4288 domain-containing protein [Kineosporia mesophila]MCD5352670.1 DUF4288 domain-containing protein [Kineosporia mesophila]
MAEQWFGVRCVYRFADVDTYEERVTLWRAATPDEAIALAEEEAAEYGEIVGAEYLGLAQCFTMFDTPEHGCEVFSLMRTSKREPEKYLKHFFATGSERQAG